MDKYGNRAKDDACSNCSNSISNLLFFFEHRCGRYPPEVRTAIPVEERFEHIVLSCSTTSDHAIFWIEREAETALEVCGKDHLHAMDIFLSVKYFMVAFVLNYMQRIFSNIVHRARRI